MSEGTTPAAALASKIHFLMIHKNYVIGYTSMLLYDHLLTFASEVELIWLQRFTLPTYLFFLFRYITLIVCVLNLIAEHDPRWVGTRCTRWIWLPVAIGPIISATTGIVLILRTHALYNRAFWVLYVTIPVYLIQIGIMIWSIPAGIAEPLPPGFVTCIPSESPGTNNRLIASYTSGVAFDFVIFVLTFARAVHLRLRNARIPLVSLILRDGAVYFLVLFLVNLINVSILLFAPPALSSPNARFSNLITATLIARLMLNLRAASKRTRSTASASATTTTITSGQPLTTIIEVGTTDRTRWTGRGWMPMLTEEMLGFDEFDPHVASDSGYEEGSGSAISSDWRRRPSMSRETGIELRDVRGGEGRRRAGSVQGEYG